MTPGEARFAVRINDEMYWVDGDGNVVLQGAFDNIGAVIDGEAWVHIGRFSGVIAADGSEILPVEYESLGPLRDGLRVAQRDGLCGYLDADGAWAFEPQWKHASDFRHGLAVVGGRDAQVVIDARGEIVVPGPFKTAYVCESVIVTQEGKAWQLRDLSGEVVKKLRGVDSAGGEVGGLIPAKHKKSSRWGALGVDGKWRVDPAHYYLQHDGTGRCIVRDLRNRHGLVDRDGAEICACVHDAMRPFHEGLAAIKRDGLWGYAREDGSVAIEPQFAGFKTVMATDVSPFRGGRAHVGAGMIIDREGNVVARVGADKPASLETLWQRGELDAVLGRFAAGERLPEQTPSQLGQMGLVLLRHEGDEDGRTAFAVQYAASSEDRHLGLKDYVTHLAGRGPKALAAFLAAAVAELEHRLSRGETAMYLLMALEDLGPLRHPLRRTDAFVALAERFPGHNRLSESARLARLGSLSLEDASERARFLAERIAPTGYDSSVSHLLLDTLEHSDLAPDWYVDHLRQTLADIDSAEIERAERSGVNLANVKPLAHASGVLAAMIQTEVAAELGAGFSGSDRAFVAEAIQLWGHRTKKESEPLHPFLVRIARDADTEDRLVRILARWGLVEADVAAVPDQIPLELSAAAALIASLGLDEKVLPLCKATPHGLTDLPAALADFYARYDRCGTSVTPPSELAERAGDLAEMFEQCDLEEYDDVDPEKLELFAMGIDVPRAAVVGIGYDGSGDIYALCTSHTVDGHPIVLRVLHDDPGVAEVEAPSLAAFVAGEAIRKWAHREGVDDPTRALLDVAPERIASG